MTTTELAQAFKTLYDRMILSSQDRFGRQWDRRELASQPETEGWEFDNVRLYQFYADARKAGLAHEAARLKAESQIR